MSGIELKDGRKAMIRTILAGAWVLSIIYVLNQTSYFSIIVFAVITLLLKAALLYKLYKECINGNKTKAKI